MKNVILFILFCTGWFISDYIFERPFDFNHVINGIIAGLLYVIGIICIKELIRFYNKEEKDEI